MQEKRYSPALALNAHQVALFERSAGRRGTNGAANASSNMGQNTNSPYRGSKRFPIRSSTVGGVNPSHPRTENCVAGMYPWLPAQRYMPENCVAGMYRCAGSQGFPNATHW